MTTALCADPVRFRSRLTAPTPEPGDVIEERGPRIGTRWWQITDTRPGRIWLALHVRPIDVIGFTAAIRDGADQWYVDRTRAHSSS